MAVHNGATWGIQILYVQMHQVYGDYYNHFMAPRTFSGTTWVSWYQQGKTSLDLLEQEIVSDSGISWAICKSAPRPRQTVWGEAASHYSVFFIGWMPFLLPNQQHQSTEGISTEE